MREKSEIYQRQRRKEIMRMLLFPISAISIPLSLWIAMGSGSDIVEITDGQTPAVAQSTLAEVIIKPTPITISPVVEVVTEPVPVVKISPVVEVAESTLVITGSLVEKQCEEAHRYIVLKDDTLSAIAGKEYGDSQLWPQLFAANNGVIEDPHRIYPKQILTIPCFDDLPEASTPTTEVIEVTSQMTSTPTIPLMQFANQMPS